MSENESGRTSSAFETFKSTFAFVGGLLGILYAAGFLIVSTNLMHHGLVDLSLAKPRYLSVGVCFAIVAGLTVVPTSLFFYVAIAAMTHVLEMWKTKSLVAWVRSNLPMLIQGSFYILLFFVTTTVAVPFLVILLASHTGPGLAVYQDIQQHATVFWRGLWEILPGWFLPLIFCGAFLGQASSMVAIKKHVLIKLSRPRGNLTERKLSRWIIEGCLAIIAPTVLGALVVLSVVATHTYVTDIYPKIKASFGGGDFGSVRFITDQKDAPILKTIIPMESDFVSSPIRLLGEGANTYAVLVEANGRQVAAMIDKTLVRGIVAEERTTSKQRK